MKIAGFKYRCESCGKSFEEPARHHEPYRDIYGSWESDDWDECPYCHMIITTEWLIKLKKENKK